MQDISSAIQQATVGSSRTPGTRLHMCWDREQTTTEWFRLDQSALDSNAVLTLVSYSENEPVQETITDADKFIYQDESDNVISAEGLVEFNGDNEQAVLSELDIILDNSNGRYTPDDNKNVLLNSSFESYLNHWNMIKNGGNYELVGTDIQQPYYLSFNGVSDYVSVPDSATTSITGDLTISAWVNVPDRANYYMIATKVVDNGANLNTYEFRISPNGKLELLGYDINFENRTSTDIVPTGQWVHVAVTRTTAACNFYINGVNGGTTDGFVATNTTTNPLLIGKRIDGYYFKGSMDEVRIYSKVLSQAEVTAQYNGGNGICIGTETGLVAGYHFNEGIGGATYDISGNSNHGTVNGCTWVYDDDRQLIAPENSIVSGSSALRFTNPNSVPITSNYVYSDSYSIQSGASYTGSVFARGTGDLTIRIVGIGSGVNAVSSGINTFPLSSGSFQRFSVTTSLPIEASTARIDFGVSSGATIIDCAQLEQSNVLTSYDDGFIGDLILPRRPSKLQVEIFDTPDGIGGPTPAFVGLTETIEPDIKAQTTHIHSYDFGNELQNKKTVTPTSTGAVMFVNENTKANLIHLADMAGLTSDNYNFEEGKNIVPFFWVQDGTIWFYMSSLAEAEGGRIFFDENGVLNFWNRDHIQNNVNSQFQFTEEHDITDYSYKIDKNAIYNHIIVKTSPREVQANQVVWSQQSAQEIKSGENITIWATLDDPITGATTPTATGSTSYIRGNTAEDNSGDDISANLFVQSFYAFATDIKIIINNQSGKDGYITGLSVFGTPAKVTKNIQIEKLDDDSINTYGEQVLQIENDYILNESYATNLATHKLFDNKNPRTKISMTVLGIPYLQIGDLVTVPHGSNSIKNLMISRKRWSLAGEYIEYLDLEQKTIAVFFTLDNSRLDGTDVLAE